MAALNQ